ncbi:MAG: NUDIX hydrolase [Jatrophihabitantaceae bacterium]
MQLRQPCAGGIVFDAAGRLLLVERGRPPSSGCWSVPGGHCLPGETAAAACVRELAEETGLLVQVLRSAGQVRRSGESGIVYDIEDFVCRAVGGALRAGDDASEVRWVSSAELAELPLVPGLLESLASWDLLPR